MLLNRTAKTTIALLLVISFVISFESQNFTVEADGKTIGVPDDYSTITDAINNAADGDTILIKEGIYEGFINQTLVINKSVSLIGENIENTIVKLFPPYNVIEIFPNPPYYNYSDSIIINADNVMLTNLTIVSTPGDGIGDVSVVGDQNQITNCNITKGVTLTGSRNNVTGSTIGYRFTLTNTSRNIITGNTVSEAFYMKYADSNQITNNTCLGFTIGDYNEACSNNIISRNIMNADDYPYVLWGISLKTGTNNVFHDNWIENYHNVGYGGWGLILGSSAINNIFYRNNIINNEKNVESSTSGNLWDNGIEGNYWSDYNGTDPNQDGIGDNAYKINEDNQDNHPLMAPIKSFDAGTWEWTPYNVNIVSNSTVSKFGFDHESTQIRFNVEAENGTTGFCRVTVPKDLLSAEGNWEVLSNGNSLTPTINEDENNTYLYFSYQHSMKTIEIVGTTAIPEFSSWIILPLFLIATLTAIICKGKHVKNQSNYRIN